MGLLAFFGLALVVGFVISVVPNLLGTIAMFLLSQRSAAARAPGCWIAAGATLAFLLAWPLDLFGAGPHLLAPFIAVGLLRCYLPADCMAGLSRRALASIAHRQ